MAEITLEFIARQNERVIEHLRCADGKLDGLGEDLREVKGRLGALEAQYASLSLRVDRLDTGLWRVEQHLDLVDEPA